MKVIAFDLLGTLLDHTDPPKLFPDSRACLDRLESEFILVLVTEARELDNIRSLLKKIGILKYFRAVMHLKNEKFQKKDGSAFREVLRLYNIPPKELVVVGDVPFTDIRGAKLVGAKSIRIRRGKYASLEGRGKYETPNLEISSLDELGSVLNSADGGIIND